MVTESLTSFDLRIQLVQYLRNGQFTLKNAANVCLRYPVHIDQFHKLQERSVLSLQFIFFFHWLRKQNDLT